MPRRSREADGNPFGHKACRRAQRFAFGHGCTIGNRIRPGNSLRNRFTYGNRYCRGTGGRRSRVAAVAAAK